MHEYAVLAVALSFAAFGQSEFDAAAVERGRSEFKSTCGFCHGDDAMGNRAPDLITPVQNVIFAWALPKQ